MCLFVDVVPGPTFLGPKSFVNDADSVSILGIQCHPEPATSLAFDFAFSTESHIPPQRRYLAAFFLAFVSWKGMPKRNNKNTPWLSATCRISLYWFKPEASVGENKKHGESINIEGPPR